MVDILGKIRAVMLLAGVYRKFASLEESLWRPVLGLEESCGYGRPCPPPHPLATYPPTPSPQQHASYETLRLNDRLSTKKRFHHINFIFANWFETNEIINM